MTRCHYCNREMAEPPRRKGRFPSNTKTKDHVVPRCNGGGRTVDACLRCNCVKADGEYDIFVEFAREMLVGKKVSLSDATAMWRAWRCKTALDGFDPAAQS